MNTPLSSSLPDLQNLNELESEFYTPFIKYFEGYKIHEIAHILQLPVHIVKIRIKLARKVLGTQLHIFQSDYKMMLNA